MNKMWEWADRWGVPQEAYVELCELICGIARSETAKTPWRKIKLNNEDDVKNVVRLRASELKIQLFRNNVGALKDERGRVVRYGLANESKAINKILKSGDLIGFRRRLILPEHVGYCVAQFVSRETKHPDWRYRGDEREQAQLAWVRLVNSYGGDASFATNEECF